MSSIILIRCEFAGLVLNEFPQAEKKVHGNEVKLGFPLGEETQFKPNVSAAHGQSNLKRANY